MRAARDAEDFAADPIGRFTVGAAHLVGCRLGDVVRIRALGAPDGRRRARARPARSSRPCIPRSRRRLRRAARLEPHRVFRLPRRAPRRRRRIRDGAPVRVGAPHPSTRRRCCRRCWLGFTLAGMGRRCGSPFPQRFFASRVEAIGWLARPELGEVLREVDERVDGARGQSPLVRRLRDGSSGNSTAPASTARHTRSAPRRARYNAAEPHRHQLQRRADGARACARRCAMLMHADEKVEAIARARGLLVVVRS